MSKVTKPSNRHVDTPSDKPGSERPEHANLNRPGAQIHPRARVGWGYGDATTMWRTG